MILQCKDVDFAYGENEILKQISFTVEPGTFCAILGRNGCGKTTLLHCLNGILSADEGTIQLGERSITGMSPKEIAQHVSLVAQEHMEIFPFKVLDVVVMGRAPYLGLTDTPSEPDYERAHEALRTLNAESLAGCNFNQISGGERQIALLAMALVQASDIMLLDEPTNHLDFKNQYHLLARIKKLCRTRGISIVASMHDPNMTTLFADQVVMIKHGRVFESGSAAEIMTAEHIAKLYDTETEGIEVMPGKQFFLPAALINECNNEANHHHR